MALFNFIKRKKRKVNSAGGQAFKQNPKMHLASLLVTSFAQDQYYRKAEQSFEEIKDLLQKVDPYFAAKAGVYARHEMGMRSITHVLAAELATYISGQSWAKDFYQSVVKRPDDMTETLAYYFSSKGTTMPNALKKGFAKAFDKFDAYQLAKYRASKKGVKLIDLVNLVHPVPTKRNAKALQALVKDELRSTATWESKLTQAGQKADSETAMAELKAGAWKELIQENRLGYLALLRNLRNIADQSAEMIPAALQQLTDHKRIKNSLVLPFRFMTAMHEIKFLDLPDKRLILEAMENALEISLDNVPKFSGKTLVVLDDSGSMLARWRNRVAPIEIGAVFAAILYKSNQADLMRFSNKASYLFPYHRNSTMSIANELIKNAKSGGTNFHSVFKKATGAYDRIIILSDMQGWMKYYHPGKSFEQYKRRYQADPFVYSFDLQGYGSLQFPENKVFALAGFSNKVFDIMKLLETDRNALVTAIEKVEF